MDDDVAGQLAELSRTLTRTGQPRDAEALQRRAAALRSAMDDQLREAATGRDSTGRVQASVQVDGTVRSVYIPPDALRALDNEALGIACVEAILAARAAAAGQFAQWMAGDGTRPGNGR
jgi:DNA-binding protein YbaB